ncbi:unnamed protein product [Peniophora sp. CBMAI 1063]|nr:unnamed protein product [Peniophora sp. CBMAI 1063]
MSATSSSQIGPILIGTGINWFLLGTLCVQLYFFENNQSAKKDRGWLRIIVHIIVWINVLETCLCAHILWFFAISHWGDPELLIGLTPWSSLAVGPLSSVVAVLVQCTYARRIWQITESFVLRAFSCVATVLSFTHFGAVVAFTIYSQIGTAQSTENAIIVDLVTSFVADLLIAVSIFIPLYNARARSSAWTDTRSLYDRLIFVVISTGVLTATMAGVTLGLYVHSPSGNAWEIPAFFICKLYANSFIAALNDRFFRSEERTYHSSQSLPTHGSLRSGGLATIHFSDDSSRSEDTAIDLRPRRSSDLRVSTEHHVTAPVIGRYAGSIDESVIISGSKKANL